MPWEEKSVIQMREEFINKVESESYSMSELCRKFGISRKTGYKWLERHRSGEGLEDKSRVPFHQPNKTDREIELTILSLREQHPAWGPRKLKRRLEDLGYTGLPAVSTISDILRRNGKINEEDHLKHMPLKRFEKERANELWQMDFKGQFPLLNGNLCYPLTLLDDHSRFSLCLEAKSGQKGADVTSSLSQLFHTYGLPKALLCDNGKPWGDNRLGISSMDVWLMQLDILPIHIRPHHPQTQGKEERFHLTLKKELLKRYTFDNQRHAQQYFDRWRKIYNRKRPHEALNMDVPERHYIPSKRKMSSVLQQPEYSEGCTTRKTHCGVIRFEGESYYLSDSFDGQYLQLYKRETGIVDVLFGHFKVACINPFDKELFSKKNYSFCSLIVLPFSLYKLLPLSGLTCLPNPHCIFRKWLFTVRFTE